MASPAAPAGPLHASRMLVSGKVQGVFYRKYTRITALSLGVTGWVRNLPDGRVEIFAEGTAEQLQQLQTWCRQGSPRAEVADVVVTTDETETKVVKGTKEDDKAARESLTSPSTTQATASATLEERLFKSFEIVK